MFSVSLSGMLGAQSLLDTTASRIANSPNGSVSAVAPAGDSWVMSNQMTSLMSALNQFEMNSRALEAEVAITKIAINLIG